VVIDSGATLGEVYYAVSKASTQLAFAAGLCPTIGVGGHLRGGGFGMLLRKYGAAIDSILDATLVDAEGRLLDKQAMGMDVFWAIRGGGGESFGIVLSWTVKLVPVPPKVTMFKVPKTLTEGAIDILTKWQVVAPALPEDLFIRVLVQKDSAEFQSMYLGTCDTLLPLMSSRFPELGLNRTHCKEMTWIQSVPWIYLGSTATVEDILNRTISLDTFNKATSDYVLQPIPKDGWVKIFAELAKPNAGIMITDPYGGKISSFPESATPFPHRGGVRAIQHPVHELLDGGNGWIGADRLAQVLLRVHDAVREQEPEAGLRELPGPRPRRERRRGQRHHLQLRKGLGRQVLQGQLQEARVRQGQG
jgi:hypothetical protein